MQIRGKLINILEAESGTSKNGKAWEKQSCIVETDNKYNNIVCVTAFGEENVKNLNKLKVGNGVAIDCNIYSREYKGKFYNQIDGWRFATSNGELENFSNDSNKLSDADDFITSDDMPF
tara:strand:+ start:504 stop:860 length:357 start_codon:yes stop_codon:yes gene_type:complete